MFMSSGNCSYIKVALRKGTKAAQKCRFPGFATRACSDSGLAVDGRSDLSPGTSDDIKGKKLSLF